MKRDTKSALILIFTLLAAIVGFFLRLQQLDAYDAGGRPPVGSGMGLLTLLSALVTIGLILSCRTLKKCAPGDDLFSRSVSVLAASLPAALLLAAGNAVLVMRGNTRFELLLGASGVIASLCLVAVSASRYKGSTVKKTSLLIPIIYFIVYLIFSFKQWSRDPAILDYCFKLFALILVTLSVFHLSAFRFGVGKRRTTAFLCMLGVFFCAVTLADGGLVHGLIMGGSLLYLLAGGWSVLRATC